MPMTAPAALAAPGRISTSSAALPHHRRISDRSPEGRHIGKPVLEATRGHAAVSMASGRANEHAASAPSGHAAVSRSQSDGLCDRA
jgi:hypothetical protein